MNLRVPKKLLYLFAGLFWLYGGIKLLTGGFNFFIDETSSPILNIIIGLMLGFSFFFFKFKDITLKNKNRIKALNYNHQQFYNFIDRKGFIMIISMISLGVFLRLSGIVPQFYLSFLYLFMGLPLFISSFIFFYEILLKTQNA